MLRFPDLVAADLVGTAYDTLFKGSVLKVLCRCWRKRVVAPLHLYPHSRARCSRSELVRRRMGKLPMDYNYWRLSPWHPPFARRRILRPRQPHCVSCANAVLRRVNESIWRR